MMRNSEAIPHCSGSEERPTTTTESARQRRKRERGIKPEEHGTTYGSWLGCDEPCCKAAVAAYKKRLRNKRYVAKVKGDLYVDNTGVKRRIRALMRNGWRQEDIAALAFGVGELQGARRVNQLLYQKRVHRLTHVKIDRAYRALQLKQGPSERNRNWGINRNWPSPLCWDPETIDDPKAKPQGLIYASQYRAAEKKRKAA